MPSDTFFSYIETANKLSKAHDADALLLLVESPIDWKKTLKKSNATDLLICSTLEEVITAATEAGCNTLHVDMPEATVQERLSQAVLAGVAAELIPSGGTVVAVYASFDTDNIDTISVLQLSERLGRLTARDLRKLETKVPLETLKLVCRSGGSILAGKAEKANRLERCLSWEIIEKSSNTVAQGVLTLLRVILVKNATWVIFEFARESARSHQLDGMFIISADATVEGCARIIDTPQVELTMTTGLGSRHYSGAAISIRNTKAIAVVVSETSGTVRIFQNGEVVLRIEPFRRAMKWKDLGGGESSPPTDS